MGVQKEDAISVRLSLPVWADAGCQINRVRVMAYQDRSVRKVKIWKYRFVKEKLNYSEAIQLIPRGVNLSAVKNECYVINQGKSSQSIVSKTGHSASNDPSHDRKHRRRRKNPMKQKNVKVHHIHRVKTRRFFVAGPKCRVGYC